VNLYLYDPSGNLVAKSEQRYTTSETVQYNAPKAGYYLVKVQAKNAYKPVSFTGASTAPVRTAYVNAGTIAKGQTVSLNVNPGSTGSVNARLTWGWSFYAPTMSLFGPNGGKVADAGSFKEGLTSTYAHLNFAPASTGTYVLKLDGTKLSGMISYKLITPYQL
jgi:serine protease AprX